MLKQIKVKTEKQATRCEICHQSDMFDAESNNCSRCSTVEKALEAKPKITTSLWSPRFALLNDQTSGDSTNKPGLNLAVALLIVDMVLCTTCFIIDNLTGLAVFILLGLVVIGVVFKKYKFDDVIASLSKWNENARYHSTQQMTRLFEDDDNNAQEPEIITLFGNNKKKEKSEIKKLF